jgi:hypothetical protein
VNLFLVSQNAHCDAVIEKNVIVQLTLKTYNFVSRYCKIIFLQQAGYWKRTANGHVIYAIISPARILLEVNGCYCQKK